MSVKLIEDSKVLSIRVSEKVFESIKSEARQKGLTSSVYVRSMLYDKFPDVPKAA